MQPRKLAHVSRLFTLAMVLTVSSWANLYAQVRDSGWLAGGAARQIALGGGGFGIMGDTVGMATLTTNPYSLDPLDMLRNPAWVGQYTRYLWLDLGTSFTDPGGAGQKFGATFSLGSDFHAGFLFAREDHATTTDPYGVSLLTARAIQRFSSLTSQSSLTGIRHTWEVLVGYDDRKQLAAGLGASYFTYGSSTTSTTGELSEVTHSQIGLNPGVIIHFSEASVLDLGLTLLLPKVHSVSTTNDNTTKFTVFGTNLRFLQELDSSITLIPIVNLYLASGATDIIGSPRDLPANLSLDAGFGVKYTANEFTVSAGPSFGYYTRVTPSLDGFSPKLVEKQIVFPRINVGAEWDPLQWLTVRLGYFASSATQTRVRAIDADNTRTITTTVLDLYSLSPLNATSGVTLGLGLHTGGFSLDGSVGEGAVRRVLGLFSGSDTFGAITTSYRFN